MQIYIVWLMTRSYLNPDSFIIFKMGIIVKLYIEVEINFPNLLQYLILFHKFL